MIGLIQRVTQASVSVDSRIVGSIQQGLVLLLGVEKSDTQANAQKLAQKVLRYRVFADDLGKMNNSLVDINGQLLVVSQFTLVADTQKGNRPGFSRGAPPALGEALYEHFIDAVRAHIPNVQTGEFGANMQVSLVNDGPVTFSLQC
ncbi:D-aminoacyl-tRNA deacylase [Alteromonas oceanisediminis]|uniref:D-aminoacyl-tRNA deacylase n=1 Tax=Alteromonas oceanisediminis TaxID=2836180 RepID=UPI001BD9E158|nr:D-aminoacyl-tRNA deacylase [Alteromonas oceanisediminis]MBT0587700.1 D-tyrosyl-tRNA(Tyr) deacylase [Alteromonas oceanisediminis]